MPALAPQHQQTIRAMLANGVRPKAVARELGVGLKTVGKYGRGVDRPRFVPAYKICVTCGSTYFPTAPSETPGHWQRRVACSVPCGARMGGRPSL